MPLRALLRFDVSPTLGAGHMARCLALAAELEARGLGTSCAVNADGIGLLPPSRHATALPVGEAGVGATGRFALAVVDHYGHDANDEVRLRRIADRIVVIDDLADRPHAADVLIDSAPLQSSDRYRGLVPCEAVSLLGADYALLREEFAVARVCRPAPPSSPAILVSMGAGDAADATSLALDALVTVDPVANITVVLGREAPHERRVAARVAAFDGRARLLSSVSDMADLAGRHTIAIGAPGVSALERACLGLPQILLTTAANQTTVAAGLELAGAAVWLGASASVVPARLADAVRMLLTDPARRDAMGQSARRLVDGWGARRVAAHILADTCDRNAVPLTFRRVRQADADELYSWQIDPTTRLYSRDASPPSADDHKRFMARRVDGADIMEVAMRGDTIVGVVRAERRADGASEVSIAVAPRARGTGVGRAALSYLDALIPQVPLTAYVDPRNAASLALFTMAGYQPQGHRRLVVQQMQPAP